MKKTILITGSTDGIGLETAKAMTAQGHRVLMHGRNPAKLETASAAVGGETESYTADLSRLEDTAGLADAVKARHGKIDVLINNAGIYKTANPVAPNGLDVRFVVNTLAPYLLTRRLLPSMEKDGRIVNLASAAQSGVNLKALAGETWLNDMDAYAQSKLAITMWSFEMASEYPDGPAVIAVNPGSLLASKMVKEGFGIAGNDLSIGVDVLMRAALSDPFATATGRYFDNDIGDFGPPHTDALDPKKRQAVTGAVDALIRKLTQS